MNTMYVNYFHFNGFWFYSLDQIAHKKEYRPYIYFDSDVFPANMGNYILLSDKILTHKEAKEKLSILFPKHILNKSILFHESPRNKKGNGSRPKKSYHRKKNYIQNNKKDVY